ncbi:hypothetical protein [Streptomyces sp. NPDC059788]|uniref:hypothetical protein n=1 Tax=Streptomyces sp. NPDC059788 TaxID=3346948 RepID=UPI003664A14B
MAEETPADGPFRITTVRDEVRRQLLDDDANPSALVLDAGEAETRTESHSIQAVADVLRRLADGAGKDPRTSGEFTQPVCPVCQRPGCCCSSFGKSPQHDCPHSKDESTRTTSPTAAPIDARERLALMVRTTKGSMPRHHQDRTADAAFSLASVRCAASEDPGMFMAAYTAARDLVRTGGDVDRMWCDALRSQPAATIAGVIEGLASTRDVPPQLGGGW